MAKSVNKVILLGNVGKDPEIRSTGGGTMVASFTLATSDRTKDAQGNWQDRTEWHNLKAFGRTAEIVRDYVKKGAKLFVEGRLTTRSWDDKDDLWREQHDVFEVSPSIRPGAQMGCARAPILVQGDGDFRRF